jgi:DNA-binding MarR family transcriptional regulator
MKKSDALETALRVSHAHATLNLHLDEALGTLHGLAWRDYILLRALATSADGHLALADLVDPMGVPASAVLRSIGPLEKTGLVQREPDRRIHLRRSGRRVLQEATATAERACERALRDLPMP